MESVEGSDALLTIAEVLVALAASTGIILALTRDPEHWRPLDASRVFVLLSSSLSGAFLALLPFGLHFAGLASSVVWRVSSGTMVVLSLVVVRFSLPMFGAALSESRENFRLWISIPIFVASGLNLVAQSLNGLAVVFPGLLAVFFGGLLWSVALSALVFILIIFNRPKSAA
jgi:hypothetical protein